MLKRLRVRFVVSVMISVVCVLLLAAAGICVWNYSTILGDTDRNLDGIASAEQNGIGESAPNGFPMTGTFEIGPNETEYTTRFFSVHIAKADGTVSLSMDFISAVTDEEAADYAREALASGSTRGWHGIYRYLTYETGTESVAVFLNASAQLGFLSSLVEGSLVIVAVTSIMILLLVMVFSGRAIRPYLKNMEQQKRFITDASHELKTPLTSIATSAEVLAMEIGEESEWIRDIRSQTARMTRLVNSLVTLSRLNEEVPFPEMSVFSLTDAAWETAEPFRARAKASGKKCEIRIDDELSMKGDADSIRRLISVLMSNAVKYSDAGGTIRLNVYRSHGRIVIETRNPCAALQTAELDRLFERFYRPDNARSASVGGSGIGLAIAKAVTEAHRGKISAKPDGADGVIFRVSLPC